MIDGYNEIVEGTSNSSSVQISNRASVMKRIALTNKADLEKVGISYDFKTGALNNYGLSSFFGSWFI